MRGEVGLAYHCAPTITWVKDTTQTILVEEEEERFWSLQGVEAVIWDLLTLGYTFDKIVAFLAVLLDESEDGAGETLLAAVRGWEKAGIVCATRENGRG